MNNISGSDFLGLVLGCCVLYFSIVFAYVSAVLFINLMA